MPSPIADATLLAQVRLGRTDAFQALVLRHQHLVCAITFSRLGDRSLSEDVAQETFLAAWRARDEVREPERLRAWLCSTARNLAIKARHRLGRTTSLPAGELVDEHVDLEDGLAARESEALVWRALEAVPAAYREPLVLYYREGRSASQVAELLGLTVNTVEQRLSRGRRHLKQEVEGLVERTLARSRPSAGFAAGVMAALPELPTSTETPTDTQPETEADTARPESTPMFTTLTTALAMAGAMTLLAVAAHAAITTEAPTQHASALEDTADAGPTAAPALAPTPTAPTPARTDARSERESLADARAELERAMQANPGANATATAVDYELTRLSPKQVAVDLAGGPSKLRSGSAALGLPQPETPVTLRTLRGRVLDETGRPVAGAVVVTGKSLRVTLGTSLSAQSGTTTGRDGSFALELWDGESKLLLALHHSGWSPVTKVAAGTGDLALELQLQPTAALEGTVTRGGAPLEAEVWVSQPGGTSFGIRVPTDAQGRYRVDRLPSGTLEVRATQPQGTGAGSHATRSVSLASGQTHRRDLDLPVGALVTVDAEVPEDAIMMRYTLLVGEHAVPDAAALARLQTELPSDQTRSMLFGGSDLDEVMQFDDVPPGLVTVCAEALVARDELLGLACAVTEAGEPGKAVHEVKLQPGGE
jgi:RNA polymerase sigma factor (sigma-70 family)